MTPPTHQEELSAYLDGELDPARAARLEAELRANAVLQAELEELRGVRDFLRSHGPVRAPAGFHARIMQAAEAEAPPARPWWSGSSGAREQEASTGRRRRLFGIRLEGLAIAAAAAAVLFLALPESPREGTSPAPEGAVEESAAAVATRAPVQQDATPEYEPAQQVQQHIDPELPSKSPYQAGSKVASGEAEAARAGQTVGRSPGYRYVLDTTDPGVLGSLQTLAARHDGHVLDTTGMSISATRQPSSEATYAIRIPASALPSLHRELEALGVVAREADNRLFASDQVEIRVTVRLTGEPAARKSKSAERLLLDDLGR